ncbi:MAG: undecaprenyl-diphosphate phosphatase [Bacillota bacterium]
MNSLIELLKYLFLGALQGITEPLPISSSGHLVIAQAFMNMPNVDYLLEVWLNFASLIAVVILFRKRIGTLVKGNIDYLFKRDKAARPHFDYGIAILIGIIPAGIAGLLLNDFLSEFFLNLMSVGIALFVTGSFLLFVQRQSTENVETDIAFKDALVIGLFQVLALVPGISRSGTTVVGGLLRKLEATKVIEFSFMLYIPISIASMGLEGLNIGSFDHPPSGFILSFIVSGVFTYFALKLFVDLVKKGNLKYFTAYCFTVGAFSIIMYLVGA